MNVKEQRIYIIGVRRETVDARKLAAALLALAGAQRAENERPRTRARPTRRPMSSAVTSLVTLALLGGGLVALLFGLRRHDQERRDARRRVFTVSFPRTVTTAQVRAFVQTLAGLASPRLTLLGHDTAVLEVIGTRTGVEHVLRLPNASNVTLISAQENIDETPAGQLMHGTLASFNEYRSSADGADIRYKMGQKAKNGGTIGPAKLGYLNVRDRFEGREVRTIAVDPDRAPFVKTAFELYATGEYTLKSLAQELTHRGLRTRPSGRRPAGVVSKSKLAALPRDRYYLGLVTYKGVEYPGRHEALVNAALFARFQLILDAHSAAVERQRVHHHYLKGSLWCGDCHRRGIESRLVMQRTVGRRGGEYFYFFCMGRQRHVCTSRHQRVAEVEAAVREHYATVRLHEDTSADVRRMLVQTINEETRSAQLLTEQREANVRRLEAQEENLLDLAASGEVPHTKIRQRLAAIAAEREALETSGADDTLTLQAGAAVLTDALDLLDDGLEELYRRCSDRERRLINQAIFTRLYSYAGTITDEELAEPYSALLSLRSRAKQARYSRARAPMAGYANGAPKGAVWQKFTSADLLATALAGGGSSRAAMVVLWRQMVNPSSPLLRALRAYRKLGLLESPQHHERQPGPKCVLQLNSVQIARLIEHYRDGSTVYELAAEFGIDRKTVARRLKTAGVKLRLGSPTATDVDEMVQLYQTGASLAVVEERLGFAARTIQRYLHDRGVPTRDSHGRVRS